MADVAALKFIGPEDDAADGAGAAAAAAAMKFIGPDDDDEVGAMGSACVGPLAPHSICLFLT